MQFTCERDKFTSICAVKNTEQKSIFATTEFLPTTEGAICLFLFILTVQKPPYLVIYNTLQAS